MVLFFKILYREVNKKKTVHSDIFRIKRNFNGEIKLLILLK